MKCTRTRTHEAARTPHESAPGNVQSGYASACCAVVGCILAAGSLLLLIAPRAKEADRRIIIDRLLAAFGDLQVQPEPQERFVYLGLVLLFPVILAGALGASKRFATELAPPAALATLATFSVVSLVFSGDVTAGFRLSWWGVALGTLTTGIVAWRDAISTRSLAWGLTGLALAATISWRVFSADAIPDAGMWPAHLDAVFYPVIEIASGRTCLVEVVPQYGCYGHAVAPIWRLFGADLLSFTVLMAGAQLVSLASMIWFCRSILESQISLLACGLWLIIVTNRIFYADSEPYFQYDPLRLLFPSLALWGAILWCRRPTRMAAFCIGTFGALALFWNFDTGAVVMGALVLCTAIYPTKRSFALKERASAAGVVLAGAVLTGAILLALLALRSGALPRPAFLVQQLSTFYFSGFMMLPMPLTPHVWMTAIILAAVTITIAAKQYLAGEHAVAMLTCH